jgi:hypothetical protein
MWMDEQMKELKERISKMSDEELLNIVEVESDDYRIEAIDFAKAELTRRGIEFEEPSDQQESTTQESARVQVDTSWAETCARCGGKARLGVLLENKEITIFFTDKDEQHFLEVYACTQCGHVQLVVDYETEVEGN